MRALVVYESMFGNTMEIAHAITDGLRVILDTEILEVESAPSCIPGDISLLVVGAPTHTFGLSRPPTRENAIKAGATVGTVGIGLREWLDHFDADVTHTRVATFGTTANKPPLIARLGTAAGALERRFKGRGFTVVVPAQQFWVEGLPGPLRTGEVERARSWGSRVAHAAGAYTTSAVPS